MTVNEKKQYGAYYTSGSIASFIASKIAFLLKKLGIKTPNCVDPAVGDGSLLLALEQKLKSFEKCFFCGVDVRQEAVNNVTALFQEKGIKNFLFLKRDGLFPTEGKTSREGWISLTKKKMKGGIHAFISNPPWGTSLSNYGDLSLCFDSAKGQYDIYDLFVEMMVDHLSENGVYGIIVPDSIYNQEHFFIRKRLLEETSIRYLIRLGEGFFSDAYISATIIIGVKTKEKKKNEKVYCSHLNHEDRKKVLCGELSLEKAVQKGGHSVAQQKFIDSNYMLLTDVFHDDETLLKQLGCHFKLNHFCDNFRGVELSKKGVVFQCCACGVWSPYPKKKTDDYKCKACGKNISLARCNCETIISTKKQPHSKRIIVGESIDRYSTKKELYIKTGFRGINYKRESLYSPSKIVVRKTGVGITACIDYNGCMTNQVVYGIRVKEEWIQCVPLEFIMAVINSRIATYYLIKRFGCTEWKSHPYITQDMLNQIPVPYDDSFAFQQTVKNIANLVKKIETTKSKFNECDSQIEALLLKLYKLKEPDFERIYGSICDAQQLIPFKRLLNVSKEKIFSYGL